MRHTDLRLTQFREPIEDTNKKLFSMRAEILVLPERRKIMRYSFFLVRTNPCAN